MSAFGYVPSHKHPSPALYQILFVKNFREYIPRYSVFLFGFYPINGPISTASCTDESVDLNEISHTLSMPRLDPTSWNRVMFKVAAWVGPPFHLVQTGSQLHNSAVSILVNHLDSQNGCRGAAVLSPNKSCNIPFLQGFSSGDTCERALKAEGPLSLIVLMIRLLPPACRSYIPMNPTLLHVR